MCVHVVAAAGIAQLGERQTEDLKVPGSIPGHGRFFLLLPSLFKQFVTCVYRKHGSQDVILRGSAMLLLLCVSEGFRSDKKGVERRNLRGEW